MEMNLEEIKDAEDSFFFHVLNRTSFVNFKKVKIHFFNIQF